jgi:cysteine-rich repeat protein
VVVRVTWAIVHVAMVGVAIFAAAGCVEPHLVDCGAVACPSGDVCSEAHGCVKSAQIAACANVDDLASCTYAGVTADSACYDGVCLPVGCGNGVLEAGEACDDENRVAGDGCSSDCRSDELCGNGITDPGEECDDGNFQSHDGCDSKCLREQETWTSTLVGADLFGQNWAYDTARDRVVIVGVTSIVEFAGATPSWTQIPATAGGIANAIYDPVRGAVVVTIGGYGGGTWSWRPGEWKQLEAGNLPWTQLLWNAFDSRAYRLKDAFPLALETLDAQTDQWATVAMPTAPTYVFSSWAFDPLTGDLVTWKQGQTTEYFLSPGSQTWSSRAMPESLSLSPGLTDSTGALLVAGASTFYRRTASGWQDTTVAVPPNFSPSTAYRTMNTIVYRGTGSRCALDLGAGSYHCDAMPGATDVAIAIPGDGLYLLRLTGEFAGTAWRFDDATGSLLPTSFPIAGLANGDVHSALFSAPRGLVVSIKDPTDSNPAPRLFQLAWGTGAQAWSELSRPPWDAYLVDVPDRRELVQLAPDGAAMSVLREDATVWSDPIAIEHPTGVGAPPVQAPTTGSIWGGFNSSGDFLDLGASPLAWTHDGNSTGIYGWPAADTRTGNLLVLDGNWSPSATVWEREGETWIRHATPFELQYQQSSSTPVSPLQLDAASGALYAVGYLASGGFGDVAYMILARHWNSATPFETCSDVTVDLDTDGLAGCDDPDCAWLPACGACPIQMTCAPP